MGRKRAKLQGLQLRHQLTSDQKQQVRWMAACPLPLGQGRVPLSLRAYPVFNVVQILAPRCPLSELLGLFLGLYPVMPEIVLTLGLF